MIFRRRRFDDLVRRQLELFEADESALLDEARAALRAYDEAERDDAEEAYSDYQLVVEAIRDALESVCDTYAGTLEDDAREEYESAFDRLARRRFPTFVAG